MKENISTFTILKTIGIPRKKMFQAIKKRKLLLQAINITNKNTKTKINKKNLERL